MNGQLMARAHAAELDKDDTLETFMARIQGREVVTVGSGRPRRVVFAERLDRGFAAAAVGKSAGCGFRPDAEGSRGHGGAYDPVSLMRATSKLYLEEFPEKIRPRSLVTRDPDAIGRFVGEVGRCVVKPLYGAKGRNVFMINNESETNLAQMSEAVLQDGYAIVQQFVDGGEHGDALIFLLEGEILQRKGKLAAFRRAPTGNYQLANISVGGRSVPLQIGDLERGIVEAMKQQTRR